MKVINEWNGAARTPTQIIREWYAEYRDDIQECGIDGFHATELMAALAPLFAAGPWRTDVDNAERDGSYFLMQDKYDGDLHLVKWCKIHDCFTAISGSHHAAISIRAFAAINQPETTP